MRQQQSLDQQAYLEALERQEQEEVQERKMMEI
jgi:hypothetical protein